MCSCMSTCQHHTYLLHTNPACSNDTETFSPSQTSENAWLQNSCILHSILENVNKLHKYIQYLVKYHNTWSQFLNKLLQVFWIKTQKHIVEKVFAHWNQISMTYLTI